MIKEITSFSGAYRFLSNFWLAPVKFEGKIYPSSEHAYQAAKTKDPEERKKIRRAKTPGKAKRLGRSVKLRPDWESVKIQIMTEVVREKFEKNEDIRILLMNTGKAKLVEGNHWGDTFFGVCDGRWARRKEEMKTDKEQELKQKIRQLEGQVEMERKAYQSLFEEVSDLAGRATDEDIYSAMKRFRVMSSGVLKGCEDSIKKKIGNMKLNEAVNDAINKFQKEIQNDQEKS